MKWDTVEPERGAFDWKAADEVVLSPNRMVKSSAVSRIGSLANTSRPP